MELITLLNLVSQILFRNYQRNPRASGILSIDFLKMNQNKSVSQALKSPTLKRAVIHI